MACKSTKEIIKRRLCERGIVSDLTINQVTSPITRVSETSQFFDIFPPACTVRLLEVWDLVVIKPFFTLSLYPISQRPVDLRGFSMYARAFWRLAMRSFKPAEIHGLSVDDTFTVRKGRNKFTANVRQLYRRSTFSWTLGICLMIDQSIDVTEALNSLSRLLPMSRTIILFGLISLGDGCCWQDWSLTHCDHWFQSWEVVLD